MLRSLQVFTFLFSFILCAQNIQSPEEFLGYKIGTQFSRHADVVAYFEHVASNSDMVTYQVYGKTNERRPLTYAVVTTPENMANLENIRTAQLKNTGIIAGTANPDKAIVWLSYNVHGNESSSTEAAMLTLYELVTQKKEWLQNTVVIMDPCVNPDGRDRYANWYNMVKATPFDTSRDAVEHNEPWPGGRPNHYLFDLNRDWAWATQVETRQRLKIYNQWMPHIHVDFHEQGINEPYYFAPAAEPFHEIITPFQREFQTEIGKNHAGYFDKEGWLYFTRERFDLLYPSYGDTYPTYNGAIGMTYEQAGGGRAGLGVKTDEGYILTLIDRVAHHHTTGLSTVEIASKNSDKLNREFKSYFDNSGLEYKSFVLKGNPDNIKSLTELLDMHEITYGFSENGKASGFRYTTNQKGTINFDRALIVSTNQPKGKLITALFEPEAALSTPLTYDITAWSLPQAYGLEAVASTSLVPASAGSRQESYMNTVNTQAAGYLSKWNSMKDARFLAALLKENIRVRFSEKPFVKENTVYNPGTLIITRSDNHNLENFDTKLVEIANKHNRQLTPAKTGFSTSGPDFGSPDVKLINPARIALLRGEKTSSLSYGATWHFFEQQLNYPVTSIDTDDLKRVELNSYDILVVPDGYYNGYFDEETTKDLKEWIRGGGKVIAIGSAVNTFAGKEGFDIQKNEPSKTEGKDSIADRLIPYAEREARSATSLISGSIFRTQVDNTHPMAFGYGEIYPSLKIGDDSFALLSKGYNVAYLDENPQSISGFAGAKAVENLKNSLVFGEAPIGSGSVIYMVDDPLFRAFWENGKLFFVNSLFLVNNDKIRF